MPTIIEDAGAPGLGARTFAGRRMPPVVCALGIAAGAILSFDSKQING